MEKSEATFSQNVFDEVKDMMGIKTVISHSRYLGLFVVLGRSKKEVFSIVVDHLWKKINVWKEMFLLRVMKEIPIKAVTQAIPSYITSYFKIPEWVCKDIEALMARFWWVANNGERKLHWVSWDKLAMEKGSWGM